MCGCCQSSTAACQLVKHNISCRSNVTVPSTWCVSCMQVRAQGGLPIRRRHRACGYQLVSASSKLNISYSCIKRQDDQNPYATIWQHLAALGCTYAPSLAAGTSLASVAIQLGHAAVSTAPASPHTLCDPCASDSLCNLSSLCCIRLSM